MIKNALILMLIASSAAAAGTSSINWIQVFPGTSPTPRSYLAMTYDEASQKVILFGGYDGTKHLNDTWIFDGVTWTRVNASIAPPARSAAQIAYDRVTRKVILFGGFNGRQYLGDTWLWDGNTLRWTRITPVHSPPAVTGPMVFTDPNGHVDEFGGFDGRFYQATMWQWNGSDWSQLYPAQLPYARGLAAVGVNTLRNEAVLFGGLADVNPINTWTYDGKTWTLQLGVDRLAMEATACQPGASAA